MTNHVWTELRNLVVVAGHAVYVADDFASPLDDASWSLQDFQKGEPPFYVEHIRRGVELAGADDEALLVFSGGQTRRAAGARSEAEGYLKLAAHFGWWSTGAGRRATTEEFARDSFENLLFGICRFYECARRYPERIAVVSWEFKRQRFDLHRAAIRFPAARFHFEGANNPADLAAALEGERRHALEPFTLDPYGTRESPPDRPREDRSVYLGDKRRARNPFGRQPPYETTCPALRGLLRHRRPQLYTGALPWAARIDESPADAYT